MKIYYATDIIFDNNTAPSVHVDEICKNLTLLGHDVSLYLPSVDALSEKVFNYQIIPVKSPKFIRSLFFQVRLFWYLVLDIRKHKPDLIYSRCSHLLVAPTIVGKLLDVPVILEVNVRFDKDAKLNNSLLSRFLLLFGIFSFLEYVNFRLSSGIIVVFSEIKKYIVSKYKINSEKVTIITNGVDVQLFKPINTVNINTNLQKNTIYIGYIGTLHTWQGLDYFIKAAQIILKLRTGIKFLIRGSGPEEKNLKFLVERENNLDKFIKILPSVSHSKVPFYISHLDICVNYCTKLKIGAGSPFKIYEYLACAKPVVSSDLLGWREEFGDAILYVEPESPRALAETLILLIDDKNKRQEIGLAGRDFIEKGHSWLAVAEKTIYFINRILIESHETK